MVAHSDARVGEDNLVVRAKVEREGRTTLPSLVGDTEEACAIAELLPKESRKRRGLCGKWIWSPGGAHEESARPRVAASVSSVVEDGQEKLSGWVRVD